MNHQAKLDEIQKELGDRTLLFLTLSGSHAYGTNRPDSDLDYRGVFVYPTTDYLGLNPIYRTSPFERGQDEDIVIHELRRFISLALENNPNILEILYSPEVIYCHPDFNRFLIPRDTLLSQKCRKTYGGFAQSQLLRFKRVDQGEGQDSGRWKPEHRHKHLMHCFRLLEQCTNLLKTGTLDVVVHNKEELIELATKSYDDLDFFEAEFGKRLEIMDNCETLLPIEPNKTLWDERFRGFHLDILERYFLTL